MSDELAPNRTRGWLWVGGIAVAVALLAWLVLIWQRATARLAKEPAIATAVFADGFRVEVIHGVLLPKFEHRPKKKASFGLVVGPAFSRSWAHGGLHFAIRGGAGRLEQASIEHQSHRPCFITLLRASRPNGKAYTSDTFVVDEVQEMLQIKRSDSIVAGVALAPPGPASALEACGLLMEVEDGFGGWLSVSGPFFADTQDAHALALCPGIPRTSPALRLRFLRPGQEPVEVQVPNPGFPATTLPLKPEPLPPVRESNRYRVELERLRLVKGAPPGRQAFRPEFKIEAKGAWTKEWISAEYHAEDAQGNLVAYSNSSIGLVPLPRQRVVRLRYTLKPSVLTYPWQASDGAFIAEGMWDAAGKMATAQITNDGRSLGFTGIEITPATPASSRSLTGLPPVIQVKIKGEGDEHAWARLQSLSPQMNMVLFEGASQTVSGRFDPPSGGSSHYRSQHSWHTISTWHGTPRAGASFQIAIVPLPPPESHEFVVELPATAAP